MAVKSVTSPRELLGFECDLFVTFGEPLGAIRHEEYAHT